MALSLRQRSWKRSRLSMFAAVLIAGASAFGVYAAASGRSSTAGAGGESDNPPAIVEPIGKTGLNRVVLNPSAAKRLAVKTVPVSSAVVDGKRRIVIPYAAVLYDTNGSAWTYTSPKPLIFVREDIRVDFVKGGRAILSAGPPVGTAVVTVGAAEIWGVEYGAISED